MLATVSMRRVAVAAIALLFSCAACSSSAKTPAGSSGASTSVSTADSSSAVVVDVCVSGGSVAGGAQRKKVALGATVVLRVTSDVGDEVHVHGYDKMADVTAGASVDVEFTADIPGVFEAELEQAHLTLVELEIS